MPMTSTRFNVGLRVSGVQTALLLCFALVRIMCGHFCAVAGIFNRKIGGTHTPLAWLAASSQLYSPQTWHRASAHCSRLPQPTGKHFHRFCLVPLR